MIQNSDGQNSAAKKPTKKPGRKLTQQQRLLEEAQGNMSASELRNRHRQLQELLTQRRSQINYSVVDLLPGILFHKGQPYTLDDHFAFEPLFQMPRRAQVRTWQAGRQVGKTAGLSAAEIILGLSIPYFSTLFITPFFEMVRRISSNYIKDFIESSFFRRMSERSKLASNVLQRSLPNNSRFYFSYAHLDATRVRGIPADHAIYDESCRYGTLISTPVGDVPIENLQPGDKVHVFDTQGCIQLDEVVSNSHHGTRGCYRIELETGEAVECTSDSFIATTDGWRRVSTLIEEFVAGASPDVAGYDAGGRKLVRDKNYRRKSDLHESPRLGTTRVQPGEVPGITRVRKRSSQAREERRLRRILKSLANSQLRGATPYRVLVSPRRPETSHASMAESTDMGGSSLVVHGRRQRRQSEQDRDVSYGRLHPGGSLPVGFLADAEWNRGLGDAHRTTAETGLLLSSGAPDTSRDLLAPRQDLSVRAADNALQAGATGENYQRDLLLLPAGIQPGGASGPSCLSADVATMLRQSGMQKAAQTTESGSVRASGGRTGKEASRRTSAVSGKSGRRAQALSRKGRCSPAERSVQAQSSQSPLSGKTQSRPSSEHLGLPGVRTARTAGPEGPTDEVLPGLQADQNHSAPAAHERACQTAAIRSIRWVGFHPVRDIETRRHHTFFAGGIAVHNCQDFDPDHLSVTNRVLDGSPYAWIDMFGTPKTADTTLTRSFSESTQSEWLIKCKACSYWNVPSLEYDLERMIGPDRDDVSEERPGVICAKCERPIYPRTGRWVDRYPDRANENEGYHVPQIIMPGHFANAKKWRLLTTARSGSKDVPIYRFYNEICGEAYDFALKLISESELHAAATLPWKNDIDIAAESYDRDKYDCIILSIDWGGGGQKKTSWTVYSVLGFQANANVIDVICGVRSLQPHNQTHEANIASHLIQTFGCQFLVHDFGGAGALREKALVDMGYPNERIIPCTYVGPGRQAIMREVPPNEMQPRSVYRIDKSRSLVTTCYAIRSGAVRFFQNDCLDAGRTGVLYDFLALVEDKTETILGDAYRIRCDANKSDDFAQSVNMGCCALWLRYDAWPKTPSTQYQLSQALIDYLNPDNPW